LRRGSESLEVLLMMLTYIAVLHSQTVFHICVLMTTYDAYLEVDLTFVNYLYNGILGSIVHLWT
jgi:hypothetical protein